MSTANKRKGARFETDLLKFLRLEGFDTERLRLAGRDDEGDLALKVGGLVHVLEAKNTQRLDLAGWVKEAEREALNYRKHRDLDYTPGFAVVHKKRNDLIGNSYVTMPLHEYLRTIRNP